MLKWFISQQWKAALRSPMWQKNLMLNIIIGFFILLMMAYLLLLGMLINPIMNKAFPGMNHIMIFNGFLLYYFFIDLLFRFILQGLPKINIESYLHLPVKKTKIVHFVVAKTIFNVINLLPLLLLIPVSIRLIATRAGDVSGLTWMVALLLMIMGNNFLATYLKRQLGSKPLIVAVYGMIVLLLYLLDYFNLLSLSSLSSQFFGLFVYRPVYLFIPLIWMIIAYRIHYRFLNRKRYPEEINIKKDRKLDRISDIRYLKSLGITGTIIALEIQKGESFGLVGNNGAGKTTMFRCILDLIRPDSGIVLSKNEDVSKNEDWKIYTGSYLDDSFLIDFLTPEEYFRFVADVYGLSQGDLDQFYKDFDEFFNNEITGKKKLIRELSSGNRQKTGIAAALMPRPEILVLDEPFNSLDPSTQIRLKALLKKLITEQEVTMLISSHDLNHITEVCERIVVLHEGQIAHDIRTRKDTLTELEKYFAV